MAGLAGLISQRAHRLTPPFRSGQLQLRRDIELNQILGSKLNAMSSGTNTDTTEQGPWEISEGECHVGLTYQHLDAQEMMDKVRSPAAGAIVLFAGNINDPH